MPEGGSHELQGTEMVARSCRPVLLLMNYMRPNRCLDPLSLSVNKIRLGLRGVGAEPADSFALCVSVDADMDMVCT